MPLYFGLPVTCEEAYRIFGLEIGDVSSESLDCLCIDRIDLENLKQELAKKKIYMTRDNGWPLERVFAGDLNEHFIKHAKNIHLFDTCDGQFVLGYKIQEATDCNGFIDVDHFTILLAKLKSQFGEEMSDMKADLSEVEIKYIQRDPEIVKYPTPRVICFDKRTLW